MAAEKRLYSNKIYTIEEIKNIIVPIAEKYGVSKVWLFGSYARGEADETSDVDLRITQTEYGLKMGGFYADVVSALDKPVDMVDTLSPKANFHEPYIKALCRSIKNLKGRARCGSPFCVLN